MSPADHHNEHDGAAPSWNDADEPTIIEFLSGERDETDPQVRALFEREPDLRAELVAIRAAESTLECAADIERDSRDIARDDPHPEDLATARSFVLEHLGPPVTKKPIWWKPLGIALAAALVMTLVWAFSGGADPYQPAPIRVLNPNGVSSFLDDTFDPEELLRRVVRSPERIDASIEDPMVFEWLAPDPRYRWTKILLFGPTGELVGEAIELEMRSAPLWSPSTTEASWLQEAAGWVTVISESGESFEPWAGAALP